jgi:NADH:ubiquinone oxidoreductase subunit D
MDYLNPLGNNLAYVMAAEKLLDWKFPTARRLSA